MQPESWSRIRALFDEALELPEGERAAFVERTDVDEEGRRELRRLLAHAVTADPFLETPRWPGTGGAGAPLWQPRSGDTIGGYRLENSLGSGGMGTVFAARQERPSRLVALKVLHANALSADARRRFEFEAEVLGHLRHPGIAVIHELGMHASPGGGEVPWFAMEYVEGARDIVSFAREGELDVRARVERLREVCAAVQHAHQKGVIHRDLKPANVLVDVQGRTKVIDYGVARVTENELARGPATVTGYVLGTLGYISPEQLTSDPAEVDTRADVYALGVLLYELLTGRLPHDTENRPLAETIRRIVTRKPDAPSRHAPGLPRELDWITLKALAIEPERRYASAEAFADDLGRFLRQEPVRAARPTRRYRVRKFIARNRALVAAGLLTFVGLFVASIVSTRSMLHAEEKRLEAEEARRDEAAQAAAARRALGRQSAVVDALSDLFGAVEPEEDGRNVTLFELLERRRPTLEVEFAGDPELRGTLQSFLGSAYEALGLRQAGEDLLVAAIESLRIAPEHDPVQLAWLEVQLVDFHAEKGRYAEARDLLAHALPVVRESDLDPAVRVHAERLNAQYLMQLGDATAAIEALRRALEESRTLLGPDDPETCKLGILLASRLAHVQAYDEALELGRDALRRAEATTPEGHPLRSYVATSFADLLTLRGEHAEAAVVRRAALVDTRELYGEWHRNTLLGLEQLARSLAAIGESEEALELAGKAVELTDRHHPGDHDRRMRTRVALADVLERAGDPEGAQLELEGAIALLDEGGLDQHGAVYELTWRLGRGDLAAARPEYAEFRMLELLERMQRSAYPEGRKRAITRGLLGLALLAQGRDEEARAELQGCCDGVVGQWGEGELAGLAPLMVGILTDACTELGHGEALARLATEARPR